MAHSFLLFLFLFSFFTARGSVSTYEIDLNGDLLKEKIRFLKGMEGERVAIDNQDGEEVFRFKLSPVAPGSRVVKIEIRQLSPTSKVLIVYYYEGFTEGIELKGSGRIYLVTLEKNDLKTLSAYRGPLYLREFKGHSGSYSRRVHKVQLSDFNGDGVKDLLLHHQGIGEIYLYKGRGQWQAMMRGNARGKGRL